MPRYPSTPSAMAPLMASDGQRPPYRAATAPGKVRTSRTSTSKRSRLPVSRNISGKLNIPTKIIHRELDPDSYTNPGPPTNPKPLMRLEFVASTTTSGPTAFPAKKKSVAVWVRRRAQTPMPAQTARYTVTQVTMKAESTVGIDWPRYSTAGGCRDALHSPINLTRPRSVDSSKALADLTVGEAPECGIGRIPARLSGV